MSDDDRDHTDRLGGVEIDALLQTAESAELLPDRLREQLTADDATAEIRPSELTRLRDEAEALIRAQAEERAGKAPMDLARTEQMSVVPEELRRDTDAMPAAPATEQSGALRAVLDADLKEVEVQPITGHGIDAVHNNPTRQSGELSAIESDAVTRQSGELQAVGPDAVDEDSIDTTRIDASAGLKPPDTQPWTAPDASSPREPTTTPFQRVDASRIERPQPAVAPASQPDDDLGVGEVDDSPPPSSLTPRSGPPMALIVLALVVVGLVVFFASMAV